jgi:F-box and WD-40 domain protein CDC4
VLSGSDGTLKMWSVRDGTVVRDLLTGITGVWQVVFEGRWCVAASNRNDTTVLDVWDFGNEDDDEWVGEPPGGQYDEDSEDEDEDQEQADIDAMDQDLVPSESESADVDEEQEREDHPADSDMESVVEVIEASRWAPTHSRSTNVATGRSSAIGGPSRRGGVFSDIIPRTLPANDETPTRPRIRNYGARRR